VFLFIDLKAKKSDDLRDCGSAFTSLFYLKKIKHGAAFRGGVLELK